MATNTAHSDLSIEDTILTCSNSFETVIRSYSIATKHIKDRLPYGAIADERGRFRIWSVSDLADQRGIGSDEYRLRDASHIASHILVLLNSLLDVLEEMREILDGERPCLEDDSDSVSDCSESDLCLISEARSESELTQLLSNVAEIITCLMRMSIAVYNTASHDRIRSISSVNIPDLHNLDVVYIQKEFPIAEEFLKERLGRAMSHWRHRVDPHSNVGKDFAKHVSAPAHGKIAQTSQVSHQKETLLPKDDQPGYPSGTTFETPIMTFAQRQDAPSRSSSTALEQVVPCFECPVCIQNVHFRTSLEWKKHVYQDLQAYVCTFEDCSNPDRRFDTRQQWFDHEMQAHRRCWECIEGCDECLRSHDAFKIHYQRHHAEDISKEHLQIIVGTNSRPVAFDTRADCPLCELSCPSLSQLCSHLGQHQEDLCLYVLPADVMDRVDNLLESDVGETGLSHVLEDPSTTWPTPRSLVQKNSSSRSAHVSGRQEIEKSVDLTADPKARSDLSRTELRIMDSQPPVSGSESSSDDLEHHTAPHTGKGKQTARPQRSQIAEMPKIFPPEAPEPESVWVPNAGDLADHDPSHEGLGNEDQEDLEDEWSEQSEPFDKTYERDPLDGNESSRCEPSDAPHTLTTDERGGKGLEGFGVLKDDYFSGPTTMTYQSSNSQSSAKKPPIPTRMINASMDDSRRAPASVSENEVSKSSTRKRQDLRPAVSSRQTSSLHPKPDFRSNSSSTELTFAKALSKRSQQSMNLMSPVNPMQKGRTGFQRAPVPSISRPINNLESWALYNFEIHARKCAYCHDPYEVHRNHENLCEHGHRLAQNIARYLYRKEEKIYSTRKEANMDLQVEIPSGYLEVSGLLKAIERSLRHRSRRPFVSMDTSYHVAPLTITTLPIRQKSIKVEHEKPRTKSGGVFDSSAQVGIDKSSSRRGSPFEEDLAKKRRSDKYIVEVREPSVRDVRDLRSSEYYR